MRPNAMKESDLLKLVLDYLALHRIFHWRQNVGAVTNGKRFIRFARPGFPDVCCVVKGKFIGIELKRDKDKAQSRVQIQFQNELERAGGKYILAHKLEDVMAGLKGDQ